MNRGFLVVAQNTATVDYIKCAVALAESIKRTMPDEQITLLTDLQIECKPFDNVITFPYGDGCIGDQWKLANDWQVYAATPYDYTIKLEADMYIPRSIDWWWSILASRDLVISTTIRDYKNDISGCRAYRKIFDDNNLPDIYNAITYFKRSRIAEEFFAVIKDIFYNWSEYKKIIKCSTAEKATTDVVYAIAASIIGVEDCTMPAFKDFSMIHMKKHVVNSIMTKWTDEFIYEILPDTLRINTIPQLYPFHYHVKEFADELIG